MAKLVFVFNTYGMLVIDFAITLIGTILFKHSSHELHPGRIKMYSWF